MKLVLLSFPNVPNASPFLLKSWSDGAQETRPRQKADVWPPPAYLDHEEMDLQLCDSPPDAAPNPIPKGDGPKVVNSVQPSLPQPALGLELLGPREVLICIRRGIVAEGQLGLKAPFATEKEWRIGSHKSRAEARTLLARPSRDASG